MPDGFVHLHCHSEFSMLDGAARLKDLVKSASKMAMPAMAITDHGNLFGAYEWYKTAKGSPVKPIVGLEAYLTPKTHRSERKRVQFGDGTGDDVAAKAADEDKAALALLEKALAYYHDQGDKAFAAFSRQGEFVDKDKYVFVLDTKGTMLASGGPSVVLIGRSSVWPSTRSSFGNGRSASPRRVITPRAAGVSRDWPLGNRMSVRSSTSTTSSLRRTTTRPSWIRPLMACTMMS